MATILIICLLAKMVVTRSDYIVGGQPATIEEFPYQVPLLIDGECCCGGAILRPDVVITAAHCVDGRPAQSLSVRAGSIYQKHGGVVIPISEYVTHEGYDSKTTDNDVALVKLAQSLQYSEAIQPIAMVDAHSSYPADTAAIASGWGATEEGGMVTEVLHFVDLKIVDFEICAQLYAMQNMSLTTNMMCATGMAGRDSCQSDSGGPLVVGNKTVLIGIISWGEGCGRDEFPGVYTDLRTSRLWVEAALKDWEQNVAVT